MLTAVEVRLLYFPSRAADTYFTQVVVSTVVAVIAADVDVVTGKADEALVVDSLAPIAMTARTTPALPSKCRPCNRLKSF